MSLTIQIEPRTLHFKFPAGTSRGVYHERRIWLLHFSDSTRPAFHGIGECAPLFDLSPDYDEAYEARLREVCREVERMGRIDFESLRKFPSILFGLETAFLQAEAKGAYALFDTPFSKGKVGLPINGLIWMGNRDEMRQRLTEKIRQNFRCIKIKIGAIDFNDELELLARVRAYYNTECITLRVDANGAFSAEDALEKLQALVPYNLHSIEQPIRAGQRAEMARLCRESPVPIALDEELIGVYSLADKVALLETIRPAYLVLKPTLHGGFQGCEEWIGLASERGIGWWITSALESNVGLNAIAQWTAYQLQRSVKSSQTMFQGLGTGQLFTDNIPVSQLQMRGDELWFIP